MSKRNRDKRIENKLAKEASTLPLEVLDPTKFQPLASDAVNAAITKLTRNGKTDRVAYRAFENRVRRDQPAFTHNMERQYVMRSPFIEGPPLLEHAYMGGALIYLAGCEAQAQANGTKLPRMKMETLAVATSRFYSDQGYSALFQKYIDTVGQTPGLQEKLTAADDVSLSGIKRVMKIADAVDADDEAALYVFDKNADANAEVGEEIVVTTKLLLTKQMTEFCSTEAAFSGAMTELWWGKADGTVSLSQLLGASDAAYLINTELQLFAQDQQA